MLMIYRRTYNTYTRLLLVIGAVCILFLLNGCRRELPVLESEKEYITYPTETRRVKGLFLLNEGNMGSNKCTIDYFNIREGYYLRNIYPERNPEIVKELGDVGNDLQIHDGKLYAVINCSNFVEVMDVRTARHLGSINIPNCRYITFSGDKAYVSSYAGPVQIDPNARPGKVVEIDTETLQITREVTVGYQPEEMVATGGRLYVANSGGYRFPDYDRTVSVIDLDSFQVVDTIDVAINLHRMELDRYGRIYVSSRGDYYGTGADVFVIDSRTGTVTGNLGISANEMYLCGDSIYLTGSGWSYTTQSNRATYAIYDTKQGRIVSDNFITDGTDQEIKLPYGVAVNPETKEIYISDATDYVTPGYLYCFTPDGKMKWKVRTGDIPGHFAFTDEDFY
nr:YncE family protein [Bacteroides ilei]